MMLTDAQYRALKAWPESGRGNWERVCILRLDDYVYSWHKTINGIRHPVYLKLQATCNDAIREYEEAQAKTKSPEGEGSGSKD